MGAETRPATAASSKTAKTASAKAGPIVPVVEETPDTVVEALVQAQPDKRPAEAAKLRNMLFEPAGVMLLWDQLCRTRKPVGAQAGLLTLIEMLSAKADKYQMAGQEPAVQCLATLCNYREYVHVIGRVKKVMHGIMFILGHENTSTKSRESASWILRRCTEFCRNSRLELGGDRESLQLIAKVLKGEMKWSAAAGLTQELQIEPQPGSPGSRVSTAASGKRPVTFPDSAGANRPSTSGSLPPGGPAVPVLQENISDSSRPATAFGKTSVFVFSGDPDKMCIEGNLCAAIGNTCFCDEVLERLGKTEGLMIGIINILDQGSDWAQGHAGRALGNLAYIPENTKHLVQVDSRNIGVRSIAAIMQSDTNSKRARQCAVHALANLSRSNNLCMSFNRVPGIYQTLQKIAAEGIQREHIDRAIANLSQARLGTRTWRQPQKM